MLSFFSKTAALRGLGMKQLLLRGVGTQVVQCSAPAVTGNVDVPVENDASDTDEARPMVKWMDADEIDRLFNQAGKQREDMNESIAELRSLMKDASKYYAVDAPDGETDGHLDEEMEEVNHIIDDAAVLQDKEAVQVLHNMQDAVRKERARDPEHDW